MFKFENFKKSPKEKAKTVALEIKAEKDPVKKAKLIRNLNLEISRWKTGLSRADLANTAIIKEINDLIASTEIFTDEEIGAFTDHNAIIAGMTNKVKEIEPANKWPWGKKEALKPSPITPEEEGLENFETFEIFAAADSKQIPDGSHENQDAHFEDPETGIFILADGVSTFHENQDGKVYHPNNISKVSGKLADWTVKELAKKIRDLKLTEKDPAKLEYAISEFVANDLKTNAGNWLKDKKNNPESEKPVSTTLNIMVRCGDNMIVLNIGDSIVLHKKQSGEIDLISCVHTVGIAYLRVFFDNDSSLDDEKKAQLLKVAETLLFKYPESDENGDFDEGKLTDNEKFVLEAIKRNVGEPYFKDAKKEHEDRHLSTLEGRTLSDYEYALRHLRRMGTLLKAFPTSVSNISSSLIELSDGDKIISASDGIENIGFKDILEFTNSPDLKEIAEELVKQGQLTKPHDDCTVQVLEIKAITPPVTPSSPDTLDPVEQAIIVEIHNCEFTLDAGVKAQPDPEQAKEIYLKVKGKSNFINADGSINLVNLKKSFNKYAESTFLDNDAFNKDTFADSWTPDDYL
jgi:serine/threonine protein phosphatase PrpC